jgi:CotH protein
MRTTGPHRIAAPENRPDLKKRAGNGRGRHGISSQSPAFRCLKGRIMRFLRTTKRAFGWIATALVLTAGPAVAQTFDELFDPSVLQDVRVRMKPGDWETLKEHYLEDTYYRGDFQWRDLTVPIVGIRSRGSASRNAHKPGLKISFDEYIDGQKPFGLKSVVLANGIQDPSMLKQRLGLLMFARMGMPSPKVVHVRFFVNDEYIGLYQLIEPIDKIFLARVFGNDAQGKPENGGYLYEYAWKDGYDWTYLGSDLQLYTELFEPKTHETDAPSVLYGPLEELFRTFNEVPDNLFDREVGSRLDLRQFTQHLAVENFIAEFDGFLGHWSANNFYLYRFQGKTISQLLPWDKDLAFWDAKYDLFQNVGDNVLASRVLNIPTYRRLYLETLMACAAAASELTDSEQPQKGWLELEAEREMAQILTAGRADENKRFTSERFEDELAKVMRFARERAPFVASEASKELARMAGVTVK